MSKLAKIEHGLFFLTLLFLPTQLGRHFWPKFSFVYSLAIDYLSPAVYFWDFLVILLLLVFLLQRKMVNKGALNLFLFFFLSQVLSLIPSVVNGEGLKAGAGLVRAEQYLIAGLFGVYIASTSWSFVKPIVFWALSMASLGESILGILQFIKGGTLGLWILGERTFTLSTPGIATFDYYGRQFLRPYATFPHPNVLAAFLILSSILTLNKLSFVPSVVTILLTVSRSAILAGIMSAFVLFKNKGKLFLLLLILLLLPVLYTRFSAVLNFDSLSLVRREQLTETSLRIWLTSPIFGVGLNNFIPVSASQTIAGPSRFLQPVHNIFLLSLAETGLVGLIGLLMLIGYPIIKIFNFQFSIFKLSWVVFIFLGMFDHYFLTLPQGYRMLFLIWGLTLSKKD